MTFRHKDYDVIVVGGRCAGAATAMLLARAGVRTLVVERQAYGSDALSTHALMRPAVMQLARWGVLDELLASGAPLVKSAAFHYGDEAVAVSVKADTDVPGLLAPRRTVLDRVLVDAARDAGAEVVHGVTVIDLLTGRHDRVYGIVVQKGAEICNLRARLVIGADGIGSMVARNVAAPILRHGSASTSTIFGYVPMSELDGYHWHFGKGLSAGAIPTNDGEACVFVAAPQAYYDEVLRFDRANCHIDVLTRVAPELAARVHEAGIGPLKAFRGRPGYIRKAFGPGWMLVGDAGFFRDPLTAHGISDALRDAEAAATAVLAGWEWDLEAYQAIRDEFAYPLLEVTEAICRFDWTLETLKRHHERLNGVIKAEVEELSARRAWRASPLAATAGATAAPACIAAE